MSSNYLLMLGVNTHLNVDKMIKAFNCSLNSSTPKNLNLYCKTVEPAAAAVQRLTGLHGPCSNGCSEVRMRQATGNKLQVFLCVEDWKIPHKKVKVGRAFPFFFLRDFAICNTATQYKQPPCTLCR